MRTFALGLLLAALVASAAAAEPTARQLELSARYMKAMKLGANIDQMIKTMMPVMTNRLAAGRNIPKEGQTLITELTLEMMEDLLPKMSSRMETIVAETLTEQELEAAVTFYESPVGQAIVAKGPAMSAKFAPSLQPLLEEAQSKMAERLLERLCGGGGCKEPARTGT